METTVSYFVLHEYHLNVRFVPLYVIICATLCKSTPVTNGERGSMAANGTLKLLKLESFNVCYFRGFLFMF